MVKDAQKLREKIVDTAEELYLKHGVIAVSMDDIAHQLGISKKTLYQVFSSKEELVKEAVQRRFDKIVKAIEQFNIESKSPVEELVKIEDLMFENLQYQKESPIYQLKRAFPDIAQWLLTQLREYILNYLKDNIERGQREGIYKQEIDPEFTSRLFYASLIGSTEPEVFPVSKYSSANVSQKILEFFMHAMLTEKGMELWKSISLD
ncbi:MAG: TetR/AcrR family transcriptional regulator [Chlorobi bacterium]|nr:TetR/AcrR family transcriptional regulator [Chlorobiota bacterium]